MKKKVSGADLVSEIQALSGDAGVLERKAPVVVSDPVQSSGRRLGRPVKVGDGATPVNLRLSADQHADIGRLAPQFMEPGKPMPNVQDLIRRLIDGARQRPETMVELIRLGGQHG